MAAALRSLTKGPHPYLEASSPVRYVHVAKFAAAACIDRDSKDACP